MDKDMMDRELKESRFAWFSNLFVLPDGRKISAWLVLVPVILIVAAFVRHLYEESLIRPTIVVSNSNPLETGLETVPVAAPVEQPALKPALTLTPMPLPEIYSVRLGKGHQMDFVNRALAKLKSDRHDAFYQKVDDQYWILVGKFVDAQAAESELKSIRAAGKYKGEVVTLSGSY